MGTSFRLMQPAWPYSGLGVVKGAAGRVNAASFRAIAQSPHRGSRPGQAEFLENPILPLGISDRSPSRVASAENRQLVFTVLGCPNPRAIRQGTFDLRKPVLVGCRVASWRGAVENAYSMTSSARARSVIGKVRPSILAVLRLITNSTFVDCWTGRSAGFSPLRTRPVYTPA